MAKKQNGSKAAETVAKLQNQIAETEKANAALLRSVAAEAQAVDATFEATTTSLATKKQGKVAKFIQNVEAKNTRTHRVSVDFGGGMVAQASTELINLGVRALGRWSPDSWLGENSDILQGAPHFILGLGVYIAEMASRKNMVMPSTTREVMSEASKLFSQLGFSNLVRALRIRYGDGKQKDLDLQALQQEAAKLRQMNQELLQKAGGPK
jgi:hypothetical protein